MLLDLKKVSLFKQCQIIRQGFFVLLAVNIPGLQEKKFQHSLKHMDPQK